MYKTTNIESLGSEYTIADSKGNIVNTIQVVTHTDIQEAALGEYSPVKFISYNDYLEKSIEVLTGFDAVDPRRVLWYATPEEEIVLSEIIEYAVKHGYDRVILEHLDNLE
jgi:hypothetical protein